MKNAQHGASSIDLALALSFLITGLIFTLTALGPLLDWREAQTINQQLNNITRAATLSYRQDVMQSRCLSQTGTMNINRLINEQRLPHDINQGLWTFEVKLIDLAINTWARPSQIETSVTFSNAAELQAVIDDLPAGKVDGLNFTYKSPLRIDITDNWAHFNKQTGCYE